MAEERCDEGGFAGVSGARYAPHGLAFVQGELPPVKDIFRRLLTPLWLRPERALWDAHELYAVRRMLGRFERPALEYGCTEGVNTFVMLGGEFAPEYDDYGDLLQDGGSEAGPRAAADADYFRRFRPEVQAAINTPAQASFDVGVSWRQAHLEKSRRLSIYDQLHLIELNDAMTPLYPRRFRTVWSPNLYWSEPERLEDVLFEHVKILDSDGRMLTIVPDRAQIEAELWSKLSFLPGDWRSAMDRNIAGNLTGNARSDAEWRTFFRRCGLEASDHAGFLPRLVGDIYQVGFRPMFPVFLQMYSLLKAGSAEDFLDLKQHWIETIYHFMAPLADLRWQESEGYPTLWHLYELRHAR